MLKKSNILALVGGGQLPKFSQNKITIWDDHQGVIMSQVRFNSNIIKVKIREDTIIAILIDKICLLDINTLENIDIFETFNNPHGIFSMSYKLSEFVISFPYAKQKGKVQLEKYNISKSIHKNIESKTISAHESNIAYITMNNEGTLLITASDKGTLIRLFNISTEEMITELRRGKKNVKINCLAIDINTEFVGCTSDVGTVHIFDIHEVNKVIGPNDEKNNINEENNKKEKQNNKKEKENNKQEKENNKKEKDKEKEKEKEKEKVKAVKPIKLKIPERSFAKFKVLEEKSILGFCPKNTFVALASDGKYYKATFDVKSGGNCKKIEEFYIKIENNK